MNLKSKINADYITAFKTKNVVGKSLLSTLKGEITTQEKNLVVENLSDEEISKILNKFAKNLQENIETLKGRSDRNETLMGAMKELEMIESYLPKALSASEISSKIDELIASGANNMGMIMKGFAGLQADKKLVSELIKTKLK